MDPLETHALRLFNSLQLRVRLEAQPLSKRFGDNTAPCYRSGVPCRLKYHIPFAMVINAKRVRKIGRSYGCGGNPAALDPATPNPALNGRCLPGCRER